ncbi:protein-tyrosine phosphatase-like protein [Mycena floridula]|nr:protein-tyrosine phosphatase-like protein [Mycena floridula]
MGKAIPAWLSNSNITSSLHALSERETGRVKARSASRPATTRLKIRHPRNIIPYALSATQSDLRDHYSVSIGAHPDNHHRNRYFDVEPYDRTRVVVAEEAENSGGYLNASWVLELHGGKWWIASQAPLPCTATSFLSLIIHSAKNPHLPKPVQVRTVVQLTQDMESGRRKADSYFPNVVGQSLTLIPEGPSSGALKVTLLNSRNIDEANCIISTVSVVHVAVHPDAGEETFDESDDEADYGEEGPPVTFRHLLYYAWPDHGVPDPEDRASLLTFTRLVDQTNRDPSSASNEDPDPPIMVGCSAGIGRTGSFIALSSLLRANGLLPSASQPTPSSVLPVSPLGPLPATVKDDLVAQEVDFLREQRPGMVQRDEQIQLIYEVLTSAFSQ